MSKRIGILIVFIIIFLGTWLLKPDHRNIPTKDQVNKLKPSEVDLQQPVTSSLFVPYWTLSTQSDLTEYNQVIYFGITPNKQGINKTDEGYLHLNEFLNLTSGKERLLTLRMLDSEINFEILESEKSQVRIINETIAVAKEFGFSGIILDLELSALPFDSVIRQINTFNKRFFDAARKEKFTYQITIYGDVYYRIRPFDVKTLAQASDKIMIMAYDLHKAGGNPGPNFPLKGRKKYGYDFHELTDRLVKDVPAAKIVVIFGLYGYDWEVNDEENSLASAKPLSYFEIKNTIITNCAQLSCDIRRDQESAETSIAYLSDDTTRHIIWYEDLESVSQKQTYLKSRGIKNFSFWAHSYF